MRKESFEIYTEDGVKLKGLLLIPDAPKAVVQFNCGTGATKEIYLAFITYLAEHGYLCCLWEYRGIGDSRTADLKHCDYAYLDYGTKDMPAIKKYLNERFPELPFFMLAHSAGGQMPGFMNNLEGIKAAVYFGVSSGYYPYMPLDYRLKAYIYFYLFAPISIALTGYVTGPFGFMEALPKGVVHPWRDWCSKKDYFFDEKFYGKTVPEGHFQQFDFPIHVYWTPDDPISSEINTQNFWKHIHSSKGIRFTQINPKEHRLTAIGHFGFFSKKMKEVLWEKVVQELDEKLGGMR